MPPLNPDIGMASIMNHAANWTTISASTGKPLRGLHHKPPATDMPSGLIAGSNTKSGSA